MSVLTQILTQGTVDVQRLRDIKPPLELTQASYLIYSGGNRPRLYSRVSVAAIYPKTFSNFTPVSNPSRSGAITT